MTATVEIPLDNAATGYAKPLATLTTGVWGADVIATAAVGTLDIHRVTVDAGTDYGIFVQAGASPANTDTLIQFVYAADAVASALPAKLDSMLEDVGGWRWNAKAVEIIDVGAVAGSGSVAWKIRLTDGSTPIVGARVWVSTDEAGTNVVAGTLPTDDFGDVTFYLDAGVYWLWRDSAAFNFTNPSQMTVTDA